MKSIPGIGVGELEPSINLENPAISNDYAEALATFSGRIYDNLHLIPSEPDWNKEVDRVVVALSGSRSGSSLIFKALSSSPDVIAPAGEHEPWLYLSGNKFPFTPSDQLETPHNQEQLLHLIRNDLLVAEDEVAGEEFADLLHNRLLVRQQLTQPGRSDLVESIGNKARFTQDDHRQLREILYADNPGQSLLTTPEEIGDGNFFLPIENPPYIEQPLARRARLGELASKTLLFKSPSDAHRHDFYENLFPEADITYLHLTRGFVQTVNGLMDGWTKSEADFASNLVGLGGRGLAIEGYSTSDVTRAYWCFDLFPGWEKYTDARLVEVCTRQWVEAHRNIIEHFRTDGRVTFESFYTHRPTFYEGLEASTGVDLNGYDWSGEVMSTEPPSQFRWLKRKELFLRIGEQLTVRMMNDVAEIQEHLGYSMEPSTWH